MPADDGRQRQLNILSTEVTTWRIFECWRPALVIWDSRMPGPIRASMVLKWSEYANGGFLNASFRPSWRMRVDSQISTRQSTELKPDVVSISTLSDTHADFSIKAMEAGAHVFVEKPLADKVEDAEKVVATARRTGRKLVIGYILRHHPSWIRFIEIARGLGSPLVFRTQSQPAIECGKLGLAQAAHADPFTDRRLRRPLCGCDVPGNSLEANTRSGNGRASDR